VNAAAPSPSPLLEVRDLRTWFPVRRGLLARTVSHVRAVDGVSLNIQRGETLALVGESGSGKTTLGRTVLGLEKATDGEIRFDGRSLRGASRQDWRALRRRMQIVFQDPFSSLNPRMTVLDLVTEGLVLNGLLEGDREAAGRALLEEVRLEASHLHRYPHEFSGGQRQRICIARALATRPDFLVCDEMVSALDVSVQARVLNLLKDLQQRRGLTCLFITHNLAVVRQVADRVAVMQSGQVVEIGPVDQVIDAPRHPYTRSLLSAVPVVGGRRRRGGTREA
jgi:ABC-type microcin C transport system duplicated ATPase subunit YejF